MTHGDFLCTKGDACTAVMRASGNNKLLDFTLVKSVSIIKRRRTVFDVRYDVGFKKIDFEN